MASEQKESMDVNVNNNLHQKIQDELKLLEEKNTTVIEQIKTKTEEISRLKESALLIICLLYTSPSPRDQRGSRMPSSA